MHLQEIFVLTLTLGSRSHKALPSTSCDLCNCKVWSCYGQWLMRCITKKIHYLTSTPRSRGSRLHKMLTSTLDFMWLMHHQSLKLLNPIVKEKMHLQEKILFDLDLGAKVTQNVAQYPRHHVTYAPPKFDIATSHGWGDDASTRKYIKWPWPSGQGHTKCCPEPSTSCDLFSYKVWSFYVKRFRRRCIYKKFNIWPLTLCHRSHEMLPSTLYIMWPILLHSLKLMRLTL